MGTYANLCSPIERYLSKRVLFSFAVFVVGVVVACADFVPACFSVRTRIRLLCSFGSNLVDSNKWIGAFRDTFFFAAHTIWRVVCMFHPSSTVYLTSQMRNITLTRSYVQYFSIVVVIVGICQFSVNNCRWWLFLYNFLSCSCIFHPVVQDSLKMLSNVHDLNRKKKHYWYSLLLVNENKKT